MEKNIKRKNVNVRKSNIKIDERSNDELFDEIMKRKKEKQRKRLEKSQTIKINNLSLLDDKEKDKFNDSNNIIEETDVGSTKVIDNNEIKKINLENIEVKPQKEIFEITDTIDLSDIFKAKRKNKYKIASFLGVSIILISILIMVMFFNKEYIFENDTVIEDIIVVSYDTNKDRVDISIRPSKLQKECAISEELVENTDLLNFKSITDEYCNVNVSRIKNYVYFKNDFNAISEPLEVNNYIVSLSLEDNYYITPGTKIKLDEDLISVGDVEITWSSLDGKFDIIDNVYINNDVAKINLIGTYKDEIVASTTIYTTNVITDMPKEFNKNKQFLSCKQFSYDEAMLLDKILLDRVRKAGEGTRAGAVAAARFLTLEFPYRISYYWENGRLNNTGVHYVDGEGRYYHKGLYLDESKYENIEASFFGPVMWGCKMVSYEEDPPYFTPGLKYPNGLDCSGFVTWSIYNGGKDIGDYGAGPLSYTIDLTDFGEYRSLSTSLINSGVIKVGDLFSISGHSSILVGIDDKYFYVAESLNTYKGVVLNKYSKNSVMNYFTHVVLMDEFYDGDGNLTNMWY